MSERWISLLKCLDNNYNCMINFLEIVSDFEEEDDFKGTSCASLLVRLTKYKWNPDHQQYIYIVSFHVHSFISQTSQESKYFT